MRRRDVASCVLSVLWGVWSLACYQVSEDRCELGEAECEVISSTQTARNCIAPPGSIRYLDQTFCTEARACVVVGDGEGERALCAQASSQDARCGEGSVCQGGVALVCDAGYLVEEITCDEGCDVEGIGCASAERARAGRRQASSIPHSRGVMRSPGQGE